MVEEGRNILPGRTFDYSSLFQFRILHPFWGSLLIPVHNIYTCSIRLHTLLYPIAQTRWGQIVGLVGVNYLSCSLPNDPDSDLRASCTFIHYLGTFICWLCFSFYHFYLALSLVCVVWDVVFRNFFLSINLILSFYVFTDSSKCLVHWLHSFKCNGLFLMFFFLYSFSDWKQKE